MSNGHDPPKFANHPLFGTDYLVRTPDDEQETPKPSGGLPSHPLFARSFGYDPPTPQSTFVGPPKLRATLPPDEERERDRIRAAQAFRRDALRPLYSGEVDINAGMPSTAIAPIPEPRRDPWNLVGAGQTMGVRGPRRELEKPLPKVVDVPLSIAQAIANTVAELGTAIYEADRADYREFVERVQSDGLMSAWGQDIAEAGTAMKETLDKTVSHIVSSGPQMVAGTYGMVKLFYDVLGDEDAAAWAEYYRNEAARAVHQIESAYEPTTRGGKIGDVASGLAIGIVPYLVGGGVLRAGARALAIPAGAGLFGARIANPRTQRFLLSLSDPKTLRMRFLEDFASGGPIDALMAAGDPQFSSLAMMGSLASTERGRRILDDAGFDSQTFADQMFAIAEDDWSRVMLEPVFGAALASLPITAMHYGGARARAVRVKEAEARIRRVRQTLRESIRVTASIDDYALFTDPGARAWSLEPGIPVGRELDLKLGKAANYDTDTQEIVAWHVTDGGERVVRVLEDDTRTLAEGYTGPENELGPGLYVSAVPERWVNRAQGKWEFTSRLTEAERGRIVDKIRAEIDARSPGSLSQVEIDRALRDLEYIRNGDLDPDQLRRFAEQPYNIQVWREEWLAELGIRPGQAPVKVEVRAKGKFRDVSREGTINADRVRELMDEGYDGAFVSGERGAAPQLVIWNKDAITQFGDWRPGQRVASESLLRGYQKGLVQDADVTDTRAEIRARIEKILELDKPDLPDGDVALLEAAAWDKGDLGADGLADRVRAWREAQGEEWGKPYRKRAVVLRDQERRQGIAVALEHYDEVAPGWRAGKAPLELEGLYRDGEVRTVYTLTPDAREPGRYRMTIQTPDGPMGHVTFDTPEEAARYALQHHNSSGRLVPGVVDEWALTPRYLEGLKKIRALEEINARAAEEVAGKQTVELTPAEIKTEGDLINVVRSAPARMAAAGISDTHCTTCANWIADDLGRGEVWGYAHRDNDAALLGADEGGHDFLIVDDTWLVDPWGLEIDGRLPKPVLHLVRDAETIRAFYGDRANWSPLRRLEPGEYHRALVMPAEYEAVMPEVRVRVKIQEGYHPIELDRPASQIYEEFDRAREALEDAMDKGAPPDGEVFGQRAYVYERAARRLDLLGETYRSGSTKISSDTGTPRSAARAGVSGKPDIQSAAVSRESTSQAPLDQRSTTTGSEGPAPSSRTTGPLKSETRGPPITSTTGAPYRPGEVVEINGETWIAFHPTENIHEIVANGHRSLPRFKADLEAALAGRGTLFGVRVKAELELGPNGKPQFDENGILRFKTDENGVPVPSARAIEKAETKFPNGSNQFASDLVGGRVWLDRIEQADDFIRDLMRRGYVTLEDENWLNDAEVTARKGGYRARHLVVQDPRTQVAYELQVMSREIGEVQEAAHKLYERARSPGVTREEFEELMAEMRGIFADAQARYDARIASEGAVQVPPTARETALEMGPEIGGARGRDAELIVGPDGQRVSGYYKVIEADDGIPSHDAETFAKRADHPGNERGYHRDQGEQAKVDKIAREMDPGQPLMVTGSPAMGPPQIRVDGKAAGGNGRLQAIQRMYERYPQSAANYRAELLRRAEQDFGITEPITSYRRPVLVFVVKDGPTDTRGWNKLVADLNYDPQQALDAVSDSFRRGRRLRESAAALDELAANMPVDGTFRAFLDTPAGGRWFQTLVKEGVIDGTEVSAFLNKQGMLTDTGKASLERMLLGAAFSDPDAISTAPQTIVRQLHHSLPIIVRSNQIPGYELGEIVQEALELLGAVYQKGADGKRLYRSASEYFAQGDLLATRAHTEEAEILARFLDEAGSRNTTAAFRRYGSEANYAATTSEMASGGDLFGRKAAERGAVIDMVFGDGTVRPTGTEALGFGVGPAVVHRAPRRVSARVTPERLERIVELSQQADAKTRVEFDDPETETRWQDSGVPQTRTLRDRLRETFETIKHSGRRRFEALASGKRWEVARYELLRLMKASDVAIERAVERIQDITALMDEADYDLFVRKVVLDDLAEEIRLHPDHELPFGLTPETLELERAKVNAAVQANPRVAEAVEYRVGAWKELRDRYVDQMGRINVNVEDRFQNEAYFHHQVIEKVRENRRLRSVGPKLRSPTDRGFLRKRHGSELDISTDYLAAEFEVMAQLEYDISLGYALERIQKEYDIYGRVREAAKQEGVRWQDAIPEGYVVYRPRQGTTFYRAFSIPERMATELLEAATEDPKAVATLTADELKQVLAKGGPYKPMVVPEEIAKTLDNLPTGPREALARLSSKVLGGWKEWQLISPRRWLKYNLRNLSGDIEVTLTGNWRAFRQVPQAVRELRAVFKGERMPAHMREWFERGGMQTTLQVQEIGDIHKLDLELTNLLGEKPNIVRRAWDKYWRSARESTDFREAILRYANYLEYLRQMRENGGRPANFGASIPEEVMALKDVRDRAFKLSNELVGAYDQISVAGAHIRRHFIPFWSFQEINMRRYTQMVKNAAADDQLALTVGRRLLGTAVASPLIAIRVGAFAIKATGMWMGLQVYNHLMWGELEDELPPEVQGKPHIILGKTDDGKIRVFTRLGAMGDFLEWFGLDTPVDMASDWLNGRRTTTEIVTDMAKSPVNKVVGGITPVAQYPFNLLTRRTLWPDAFEPGTIRDRAEYIAQSLGLENEFRALTDRPTDKSYLETLRTLPWYEIDPGETAVWYIIEEKARFKRRNGEYSEGFFINPRSNALWNLKKSIRYGDRDAMAKYLIEYAELGGTEAGIKNAFKALHPLAGLSTTPGENGEPSELVQFLGTLRAEDKDRLKVALAWYENMMGSRQSDE